MKEVNTKWALGNFSVELSSTVDDAMFTKLANLGLRFLGQRVSAVDKVLGAFETDATGKPRRKSGWKRGDVTFTPELADALVAVFTSLELPDESKLESVAVSVAEYVPTAAAPKFKEEREIVSRHESKGDLDEWLKATVGFAGESHTVDGEDFNPVMLAAVKSWKTEMLKRM